MERHNFTPDYMLLSFEPSQCESRPWRTTEEHTYTDGAFLSIRVPRGFRTDLASVPAAFSFLIDPHGRHQRAALFHDWLYCLQPTPRFTADAIFRHMMAADGVAWWRREGMYWAVRLFGGLAWKNR